MGAAAVPVLENAQVAAREAGGIAADVQRVADHIAQELDRPKRWWEKILPSPIIWATRGVRALRKTL